MNAPLPALLIPHPESMAEAKEPYGDVKYADPGYREGIKRYPIDTEKHVRAALAYINVPANAAKYTSEQLELIKGRIHAAAKRHGIEISESGPHEGPGAMGMAVPYQRSLLSSAGPLAPPAAWFTDPGLTAPTRLTITEDGHVFGHLAQWRVCHVGIGDACVMAPKSQTGYNLFKVGALVLDNGQQVDVGKIVMGTAHANAQWGVMPSREHYDNTALTAALVTVGEDRHGIWVNGSLTAEMTPEKIVALRASALSGDWRRVSTGNLELIAALAVNSPGFPIYREKDGHAFSMLSVGILEADGDATESGEFSMTTDAETANDQQFVAPPTGIADETSVNDEAAKRLQEIDSSWAALQKEQRFTQLAALDAAREKVADTLPVTGRNSLEIRAQYDGARFRQIPEDETELEELDQTK